MFKKAELSLNVVVAAALAMIVLVILAVLVFNAGSSVFEGTRCVSLERDAQCQPVELGCEELTLANPDVTYVRAPSYSCPDGEVCCVPQ